MPLGISESVRNYGQSGRVFKIEQIGPRGYQLKALLTCQKGYGAGASTGGGWSPESHANFESSMLHLRRRYATTPTIPIRPTSVIAKVVGSETRTAEGTGLGCCAKTKAGAANRVKRHALAANFELMSFILISPDELF
jgi:hypothetical protein